MAKVTYDNTGVEESSGGGTGVKAPPNVYVARIERCTKRDKKKDGSAVNDLEVVLNVGDEYDWLWSYVGLDKASDWKLAEFTRALGMPEKGGFDPETLKGKLVRIKVNPGSYNGEYSPNVGRFMQVQDDDVFEGSDTPAEGGAGDDGPDEPTTAAAGGGDFVPSRESDPEVGSYDDWDEDDLLAEVEDRGLALPGGRGAKKDKAMKALRADDEEAGDGATEPEAEPEAEAATTTDDYDEWPIEDLVAEAKDRNLEVPRGRKTQEQMIKLLRDDDSKEPF